jgi:hypothetical protein
MDGISSKHTNFVYKTAVFIVTLLIICGWIYSATKNTAATADSKRGTQAVGVENIPTWNCGDSGGNVTATMIDAKTLIISGTGKMADYETDIISEKILPWHNINKDSITDVHIEYGVTSIGKNAFNDLINLTSVTIPNSVKQIGDNAFFKCSSMTSITIPNSVRYIGLSAFAFSGLTSVVIPDSVRSIYSGVFIGCEKMTSVTLNSRLGSIQDFAFAGCTGLTSITIPNSVYDIEAYAFDDCVNLMSIIINSRRPPGVHYHLGAAFGSFFGETDMATYEAKQKLYFSKACLYVPSNSIAAYRADKGWEQFRCVKPIESAPMGGKR